MKNLIIVFYSPFGDPTGRIPSWFKEKKIDFKSCKVIGFLENGVIVTENIPSETVFLLIADSASSYTANSKISDEVYEIIQRCGEGKKQCYVAFTANSDSQYFQKRQLDRLFSEIRTCEYNREDDGIYKYTADLLETGKIDIYLKGIINTF